MKLETSLATLVFVFAGGVFGCSSDRDGNAFKSPNASPFSDGGGGTGPGIDTDGGGKTDPRCPLETQYVFTIDNSGKLYRFDPPTSTFTFVGTIQCPGAIYSMAIDRKAFAYVLQLDGRLMKVDTRDASCTPTSFVPGQQGFSVNFGMGFSTNAAGSEDETLFVSSSDPATAGLAKIDTSSLLLTKLGAYDALKARAELTGTGDGRLFGAFEGSPYVVAEIDKSQAQIKSQAPQEPIKYPPNASNFAFAFWGGEFYLFVGPGTSTDVFKYDPASGATTKVNSVSFVIVGAGVSTCAPTTKPK